MDNCGVRKRTIYIVGVGALDDPFGRVAGCRPYSVNWLKYSYRGMSLVR